MLYSISILHQTTTFTPLLYFFAGCILFQFYIKPQHAGDVSPFLRVVFYFNSTSNHNGGEMRTNMAVVVFYFNSTSNHNISPFKAGTLWLYSISILHQTTTFGACRQLQASCILFQFYIKPQLPSSHANGYDVVFYFNSTSNHNGVRVYGSQFGVVFYFNSTSNHNLRRGIRASF